MFKRKDQTTNFTIAFEHAKTCAMHLRAGDSDEHHRVGDSGVRIVICDFAEYGPFTMTPKTESWLKRTYELTQGEAKKIYEYLRARAKTEINDARSKVPSTPREGYIPGTSLKWLTP